MFRPFFMVSVIVVGSANPACSCNHYKNGENGSLEQQYGDRQKNRQKIERQSTPPSGLILGWETRDQTQQGSLSLARSVGTGRREPWEQG